MKTRFMTAIIGCILIIGIGYGVFLSKKPVMLGMCEEKHMKCPDGSYVERRGPCGFVCLELSKVPAIEKIVEKNMMCPMDVVECPDGSRVGASGPNCEYVCPELPETPTTTTTQTKVPTTFTLEQIAAHNTRESCWSAINGVVYDLTSWIPNHPGGEKRILNLCGIDGTLSFNGKHGGSTKIMKILTGFILGSLSI